MKNNIKEEEMPVWITIKNIPRLVLKNDSKSMNEYILPVVPFINTYTGEVKLFSEKIVNHIGIKNVLEVLNKDDK